MRSSSSDWTWIEGESEKRTDLGELTAGFTFERSDFLRKEEEEVLRGRSDARAKSEDSEGSLGCVMVDGVVDVGVP